MFKGGHGETLKESMSALARDIRNGSTEDFRIYCKNWFSDRAFYLFIYLLDSIHWYAADANIGSLKSLHTLFDKYLDHMLVQFVQNRMVQTI